MARSTSKAKSIEKERKSPSKRATKATSRRRKSAPSKKRTPFSPVRRTPRRSASVTRKQRELAKETTKWKKGKRRSKQAAAMEAAEARKAGIRRAQEPETPNLKKATYNRTLHKADKRRKRRSWEKIPFNVVDEHNGTMVCMLRAIEQGYLPTEGIGLLHFDSHPDLGTLEFDEGWNGMDDLFNQRYSIRELYEQTDIATWIIPMAYMGHVDHVTWVSAWWCDQFRTGTWKLLVGKDKNDGKMKIGTPDDKRPKCLTYWLGDGAVCKKADFEFYREWTLSVVRCRKNTMALPQDQLDKIVQEFGKEKKWVLDIDEDFFSCNNPYLDDFRDLFGQKVFDALFQVYNIITMDAVDTQEGVLEQMYLEKTYMKPWAKFCQTDVYKKLHKGLAGEKKKATLKTYHEFLRAHYPKGGYVKEADAAASKEAKERKQEEEKQESMPLKSYQIGDFFTLLDVHRAGGLAALPHHISDAAEFTGLINELDVLLDTMVSRPDMVTVATSRRDRYLPDSQASTIHSTVDMVLSNRLDLDAPIRLDRPSFSVFCKNKDCHSEKPVEGVVTLKDRYVSRYVTDILDEPEPVIEE